LEAVVDEQVIVIKPDGTVLFLTHGDDSLLKLGDPQIVRASHVRFDNDTKLWHVYLRRYRKADQKLYPGFTHRKEALQHEVGVCQTILDNDPEEVERMVREEWSFDVVGAKTSG
jgi:hypothetical protein